MAETITTSQFKNGMHIELESQVWRIVEFQHVKPGKGGAFVRTKLRNLNSGARWSTRRFALARRCLGCTPRRKTCSTSTTRRRGRIHGRETFEQVSFARADIEDELDFLQPSATAQMLAIDGRPSGIQAPGTVELAVTETEPGRQGDTVSNVNEAATLETGAVVQVPLFVNEGDRIKVDTRERRYISRV